MTIDELAVMIGRDLTLTRYAKDGTSCSFPRAETKQDKDDPFLGGTYGNGRNADSAIADYVWKLSGKILVLDSYSPERREFTLGTITVD